MFIFIYLFLVALSLHFYVQAFSSCDKLVYSSLQCSGFPCCGAWTLEHRLKYCGAWAQLLLGMWNHPRPVIKPVFPALTGRFLPTAISGKSPKSFKIIIIAMSKGLGYRISFIGVDKKFILPIVVLKLSIQEYQQYMIKKHAYE